MKIAVNGCCHGELDALYGVIQQLERERNIKIDLLICCGDFESLRTTADLKFYCAPPKYRYLKDFHKYFSGEKRAPVLTIFIGGNHEASNVLRELYYGGWVAPNIFYLGHSGVIRIGGLRIAGISGIYNSGDYKRGYFEREPFNEGFKRSAYHTREFEALKLHCIKEPLDVFLSHDWPCGVHSFGDFAQLMRAKPLFREQINSGELGSPPLMALLKSLKPSFWFSGHLHVKFAAVIEHQEERQLSTEEAGACSSSTRPKTTKFLALDKVVPRRRFLQVLDIHPTDRAKFYESPQRETETNTQLFIEYDLEWLAILRANAACVPTTDRQSQSSAVMPSDADRAEVLRNLRRLTAAPCSEVRCENSPECSEELFPWPLWDAPSFKDLRAQRLRMLEVLGVKDLPFLLKLSGPEAGFSNCIDTRSFDGVARVKPPQEELDIDLSDFEEA